MARKKTPERVEERVQCSMIFSDIKGFSGITKEKVIKFCHKTLEEFAAKHLHNGNHFYKKTMGDSLFVCSLSCEETALIALRLRDHFRGINWIKEGHDAQLPIRIGVHSAEITREHEDGKVVAVYGKGFAPGARIEPVTQPGKVYCSRNFSRQLAALDELNVECKSIGKHALAKNWGEMELCELAWSTEDVSSAGDDSAALQQKVPDTIVSSKARADLSSIMHKAICHNQGRLIYFYLKADTIMQELEEAARRKDVRSTELHVKKLVKHLTGEMEVALKENYKFVEDMFELEKGKGNAPRMCFKNHYIDKETNIQYIEEYPFAKEEYRRFFKYSVSDNTASERINTTGLFYIENQIPDRAASGGYLNPRLDPEKVKVYSAPIGSVDFKPFAPKQPLDRAWWHCWRRYERKGKQVLPPEHSAYKSTLVVPSTLRRNFLPKDFWEDVVKRAEKTNLFSGNPGAVDDAERQVYAYFCMDYAETGYFNEYDVDCGYFVADVLSVYFMGGLMYTTLSDTFNEITGYSTERYFD